MMMNKRLDRYFVRWVTEWGGQSFSRLVGWDVVDSKGYIKMASFAADGEAQARAICKLLNSNDERN